MVILRQQFFGGENIVVFERHKFIELNHLIALFFSHNLFILHVFLRSTIANLTVFKCDQVARCKKKSMVRVTRSLHNGKFKQLLVRYAAEKKIKSPIFPFIIFCHPSCGVVQRKSNSTSFKSSRSQLLGTNFIQSSLKFQSLNFYFSKTAPSLSYLKLRFVFVLNEVLECGQKTWFRTDE